MPAALASSSTQTHDPDEADVIHEFQLRMRFSFVLVVYGILRVVHCVHIDSVFTVSHHMCAEALMWRDDIIEHDIPVENIRADGLIPIGHHRVRSDGLVPLSMDPWFMH